MFKIFHDNSGMKKTFVRAVAAFALTVERKQQRIDNSERCLKLVKISYKKAIWLRLISICSQISKDLLQ